ncbi:probable DNA alkylation repair enzyme [Olavius algarvensis associated proteobacterium Delta 3]|nr:probable DNA alkylation repair enzyme [Olavius algarvensis associated proteobacterium Delta 3]
MASVSAIQHRLKTLADPERASISQRFFKTGPGEYGEGDIFRGIRVPVLRKLSREYRELSLESADELLCSPIHEEHLLSLFILVLQFQKADPSTRRRIYNLYLNRLDRINNWDLVDSSAEHIVGAYLWDKSRKPLYRLAGSAVLWERRVSIMSTFHYIKRHQFDDTLTIAGMLLEDDEDLIHKAVGWMLREIGKRDSPTEERFLIERYPGMPRTMLRYAIERFPEDKRQGYLKGTIT